MAFRLHESAISFILLCARGAYLAGYGIISVVAQIQESDCTTNFPLADLLVLYIRHTESRSADPRAKGIPKVGTFVPCAKVPSPLPSMIVTARVPFESLAIVRSSVPSRLE